MKRQAGHLLGAADGSLGLGFDDEGNPYNKRKRTTPNAPPPSPASNSPGLKKASALLKPSHESFMKFNNSCGLTPDLLPGSQVSFGPLVSPTSNTPNFGGSNSVRSVYDSDLDTFTPGSLTSVSTTSIEESYEVKGRFSNLERLGSGSYGNVFSAIDVRTGEKVALKQIENVFDNIINAKRILREICILRMLRHHNVIGFRGVLTPESLSNFNDIFIVFQFVDTDMQKIVSSNQNFTNLHIKYFLYQILVGLRYSHMKHIIHRDLKPANLLVNADCSLKICDYGLARPLDVSVPKTKTSREFEPSHSRQSSISSTTSNQSSTSTSTGTSNSTSNTTSTTNLDTDPLKGIEPPSLARGLSLTCPNQPKLQRSLSAELASSSQLSLNRQMTKHVVTRWYRAPELILLTDYSTAIDIWSVACIFAELLSMEKESYGQASDRQALFPGKSCFPLSAESSKAYMEKTDQLNVIFDVIGSPTQTEINAFSSHKVRSFLDGMKKKKRMDFRTRYSGADQQALDLLSQMLQFDAKKRPTAEQALRHPYLKDVVDEKAFETVTPPSAADLLDTFAFENDDKLNSRKLRALMRKQIEMDRVK